MTHSLIPSSFSPPIFPDFHHCNPFYSTGKSPKFEDCEMAFHDLPLGDNPNQPDAWYSHPPEWEHFGLPLVVTHGSCTIQFDASGKYVEDHTAEVWFPPILIRHMAGWVMDQCVDGEKTGGYITNNIASTMNYLSAPQTRFSDPLPESITFFSLMVADNDPDTFPDKFEPGCCDMEAGIRITNSVYDAYNQSRLHSALSEDLWQRYSMLDKAVVDMDDGDGLVPWWEKFPQPLAVLNDSATSHPMLRLPGLHNSTYSQAMRHKDSR